MGRAGAEPRAVRGPRGPLPATPSLSRDRAGCRRSGEPEGPSAEGTRAPPRARSAPARRQRGRRRVAGRAALGVGRDRLEGLTLGLGPAEGGPRGVPAVGPQQGPKGGHGGGVAVLREHGPPPWRMACNVYRAGVPEVGTRARILELPPDPPARGPHGRIWAGPRSIRRGPVRRIIPTAGGGLQRRPVGQRDRHGRRDPRRRSGSANGRFLCHFCPSRGPRGGRSRRPDTPGRGAARAARPAQAALPARRVGREGRQTGAFCAIPAIPPHRCDRPCRPGHPPAPRHPRPWAA